SGVGTTNVLLPGGLGTASALVAGCVGGTGFGAARLGWPCDWLAGRTALLLGLAGVTTIGFSGCGLCPDAGLGASASARKKPSGSAALESQRCLAEMREECAQKRDG